MGREAATRAALDGLVLDRRSVDLLELLCRRGRRRCAGGLGLGGAGGDGGQAAEEGTPAETAHAVLVDHTVHLGRLVLVLRQRPQSVVLLALHHATVLALSLASLEPPRWPLTHPVRTPSESRPNLLRDCLRSDDQASQAPPPRSDKGNAEAQRRRDQRGYTPPMPLSPWRLCAFALTFPHE